MIVFGIPTPVELLLASVELLLAPVDGPAPAFLFVIRTVVTDDEACPNDDIIAARIHIVCVKRATGPINQLAEVAIIPHDVRCVLSCKELRTRRSRGNRAIVVAVDEGAKVLWKIALNGPKTAKLGGTDVAVAVATDCVLGESFFFVLGVCSN